MICNLCPRKCGAKRNDDVGNGFCQMPEKIKIAHYDLFMYEEPCISAGKGSGAIFFSGCNLNCVFCQNYDISTLRGGKYITIAELAQIFKKLEDLGASNINLVTPTHYAMQIAEALKIYEPSIPVIYNTNGYESEEMIEYMAKWVDVFLPDLKYYSSTLSKRFSNCEDYFTIAFKAIKKMRELKSDIYATDGKILQGVIIRHMILPLCTDDSIKILNVIKNELPGTMVSLMSQYVPMGRAKEFKEINRKITKREYEKVLGEFSRLDLSGYVQDLSSANEKYIPNFKFLNL